MLSGIIHRANLCVKVVHAPESSLFRKDKLLQQMICGGLQDYFKLRVGRMVDQKERSLKETKLQEKHAAEEAERLSKEHERKKAYLAKERAIEEAQQERKIKRSEKRAAEEIEQLARERVRKEAYLAREKATNEAHKARKLKAK